MQVNRDFADLFAALNAADARYLLVGGYAVAFHAEPRFTKDLDIWVEASPVNAARVHDALVAFGAPLAGITPPDLSTPGNVVQIGVPPNRIDVVTSIDGVEFAVPSHLTRSRADTKAQDTRSRRQLQYTSQNTSGGADESPGALNSAVRTSGSRSSSRFPRGLE